MCTYKDLIIFLDENRFKKEFERAFYLFNRYHSLTEGLWCILGGDECFIGRAFDWSETPQGYDYWHAIDNKWYSLNVKF